MVALSALWMPIVVSAVFVFVALMILHMLPGWHKGDTAAVPGEDQVLATLRGLNLQPGDYRFPFGVTVADMEAPAFLEKMRAGPVGTMTIQPNGEMKMGKMMGLWFIYSLIIAGMVAYVAGETRARGALYTDVFLVSGAVTFCCYSVGLWQSWIWWGKTTRFTLTNSIDGVIFALITGATFGWLWPK